MRTHSLQSSYTLPLEQLPLVLFMRWKILKIDVKTAFSQSTIEEDVYLSLRAFR